MAGMPDLATAASNRAALSPAPAFPSPVVDNAPATMLQPAYASPAAATLGPSAGASAFPGGSTRMTPQAASGLFDDGTGLPPASTPAPRATPGVLPSNSTAADTTKLNPPTAGPLYDSAHLSPTDTAAAPVQMVRAAPLTGTLAEHMKNTYGVPMTTHDTREHDVRHMTLDEFKQANRHLTPMDIQMMTPMLPQQLSPHEQLIKGGLDIANTEAARAMKHPELYLDPQTKQQMTPAQVWFHYASQTGSFQNPYALNNAQGVHNLIGGGGMN